MSLPDYIINDSSIHKSHITHSLPMSKDCAVRIGVVRQETFLETTKETKYIVEVWDAGRVIPISCVRTSRFGGIYNFEEYTHRGFNVSEDSASRSVMALKSGDHVVIAYANGDAREGVILGELNHSGRSEKLKAGQGPAYLSEFNGIERSINADGEYITTFKGQPTNLKKLLDPASGDPIKDPTYDTKVGGTYAKFDKTGSWTLSDNSEKVQSIFVDKPNGKITITSGATSLVIDKNTESYTIVNKKTTFTSADEFNLTTKKTTINSSASYDLKSAKINTDGEWTQKGNITITGDTKQTGKVDITGDMSTTGITNLAGGQFPLIYDIILVIGIGNLGVPVISFAIPLKTTQTKAT